MSAAGRGEHRGGDVDFYPTPAWCVDRLLENCGRELFPPGAFIHALEPTCGDGAIVRATDAWLSNDRGVNTRTVKWTGVELQRGRLDPRTQLAEHYEGVDFRSWVAPRSFDVSMGNVAYNVAESLIRRALVCSAVVVQLLHLGFLGSDERVEFFANIGARPALRVLPDRPSFDGEGTDSIPYAWYIWGHPTIRGVEHLAPTPASVRKAQKPQALVFEARQCSLFEAAE